MSAYELQEIASDLQASIRVSLTLISGLVRSRLALNQRVPANMDDLARRSQNPGPRKSGKRLWATPFIVTASPPWTPVLTGEVSSGCPLHVYEISFCEFT